MRDRFFSTPTDPNVLYNSNHSSSIENMKKKGLSFAARHNPYDLNRSCEYSNPRYIESILPKPIDAGQPPAPSYTRYTRRGR